MSATVRDNPDDNRYELVVDDQVMGWADYRLDGTRITILHAEVDGSHGGRGLGKQLVTDMLDDIESRGLEVDPKCPYVRKVIAKHAARYLHLIPVDVQKALRLADRDD